MLQPALYDGVGGPWINTLPYQGIYGPSLGNRNTALHNITTGAELASAHGGNVLTLVLAGESAAFASEAAHQIPIHISHKSPQFLRIGAAAAARTTLNLTHAQKLNMGSAAAAEATLTSGRALNGLYGGMGRSISSNVFSVGTGVGIAVSAFCDVYTYATGGYTDGYEFMGALTVDTLANVGAGVATGVVIGLGVTLGAPVVVATVIGIGAGAVGLVVYNYWLRDAHIERLGNAFRNTLGPAITN